jgi:hypothetical protein
MERRRRKAAAEEPIDFLHPISAEGNHFLSSRSNIQEIADSA